MISSNKNKIMYQTLNYNIPILQTFKTFFFIFIYIFILFYFIFILFLSPLSFILLHYFIFSFFYFILFYFILFYFILKRNKIRFINN